MGVRMKTTNKPLWMGKKFASCVTIAACFYLFAHLLVSNSISFLNAISGRNRFLSSDELRMVNQLDWILFQICNITEYKV